jgi:hypothetical protein
MKTDSEQLNKLLKAISQVSVSAQFKPTKALRRETEFKTFEVSDNFNIKLSGDIMKITYSLFVFGKLISQDKLKADLEKIFSDILSFIKKEVKEISGMTLGAKEIGDQKEECVQLNINKQIKYITKTYKISKFKPFALDEE